MVPVRPPCSNCTVASFPLPVAVKLVTPETKRSLRLADSISLRPLAR